MMIILLLIGLNIESQNEKPAYKKIQNLAFSPHALLNKMLWGSL